MDAKDALRQIKAIVAQLDSDQCDELLRIMSPRKMRNPAFAKLGTGIAFMAHLQKRRKPRAGTREWMEKIHAMRDDGKKHSVIFSVLGKEAGFPYSSQSTMESKYCHYRKIKPEWFDGSQVNSASLPS